MRPARAGEPRIEVVDAQDGHVVDTGRVREVAAAALARRRSSLALSVVLTDDATIHDLNRRFLGHDHPTDVLTFPLEDEADGGTTPGEGPAAEIVLSVETAVREARARGIEPELEVALYAVHGVLHVLGFDDHEEAAAREMHRETAAVLESAGYDVRSLGDPFRSGAP